VEVEWETAPDAFPVIAVFVHVPIVTRFVHLQENYMLISMLFERFFDHKCCLIFLALTEDNEIQQRAKNVTI
jgi:hypothetical protein